jgi:hypothetical protein
MHLPMQSEPVQRTTVGQPIPGNSVGQSAATPDGIQPSGIFDDIVKGIGTAVQVGGPLLGALGF